ncbi:unnamed protein product [Staurois parvus]|uniref:Uncharacterized protein n=1 Tax=Staurois parvus TaxID=386267 RepID=A0ABN9D5V8_9NEOB|nr:unnamed protein product [Staurois parvus]
MLTPSRPVPLVQCQCFFIALITVLVSHDLRSRGYCAPHR